MDINNLPPGAAPEPGQPLPGVAQVELIDDTEATWPHRLLDRPMFLVGIVIAGLVLVGAVMQFNRVDDLELTASTLVDTSVGDASTTTTGNLTEADSAPDEDAVATSTAIATSTPSPTTPPTALPVLVTPTPTAVPPTAVPPTAIPATATPVPPTATTVPATAVSATATPVPPTATSVPATATAAPVTATAVPPTAIPATATPTPPTATPVPATATPVPPTAAPPTATAVPPTAIPATAPPVPATPIPATPVPATPTATAVPVVPATATPIPQTTSNSVAGAFNAITPEQAEANFIAAINQYRAGLGLQTLRHDPAISAVARQWSVSMSQVDAIPHNPNTHNELPAGWLSFAENVGMGNGSWLDLHNAFLASPSHEQNIRRTEVDSIGVGMIYANNKQYITQLFVGY